MLIQAVKPIILSLVNTAQSDETRQRRTNELRAINEVGQAINSGLGLNETLELIADRATEALHGKAAAIRFVVEDGTLALGTVIVKGGNGLDLQNEKRIAQYVADAGEPILIDDVRTDWEPWNLGSSLVCIPHSSGRPGSRHFDPFGEDCTCGYCQKGIQYGRFESPFCIIQSSCSQN